MSKIKVYIASPYTIGDQAKNVRVQIDCFQKLREYQLIPFAPLLSHFQHMVHPNTYDKWMEWDFAWIDVCDCLLRLPGESRGADLEVEHAKLRGIPVFYSIDDILKHYGMFKNYIEPIIGNFNGFFLYLLRKINNMKTIGQKIINGIKIGFNFLFSKAFLLGLVGVGVIIMALQFIFGYDVIEPIAQFFSGYIVVPSLIIIFVVLLGAMIYYAFIKKLINKIKKK